MTKNLMSMEEFRDLLGTLPVPPRVRVVMTLVHPNETQFTDEGREYAYLWLTCRLGVQLAMTYAPLVRTSVQFSREPANDLFEIEGVDDSLTARRLMSAADSAYYDALIDWYGHVNQCSGILPSGNPMFGE